MDTREFKIEKGALQKIGGRKGERLRVSIGEVWVTQHGDPADYYLRTGESLVLRGEGATLAHACKPTVLELLRPLASGTPPGRNSRRALAAATAMLWRMFA
jgi:hypothetical protein